MLASNLSTDNRSLTVFLLTPSRISGLIHYYVAELYGISWCRPQNSTITKFARRWNFEKYANLGILWFWGIEIHRRWHGIAILCCEYRTSPQKRCNSDPMSTHNAFSIQVSSPICRKRALSSGLTRLWAHEKRSRVPSKICIFSTKSSHNIQFLNW